MTPDSQTIRNYQFNLSQMWEDFRKPNYLSLNMQADKFDLLPSRKKGKSDGTFENLQKQTFISNYYPIRINILQNTIYQFSFSLSEKIPKNSVQCYQKAICSIKQKLKKQIGLITFKGQMLWGYKSSSKPITIGCQFMIKDEKIEETVEIIQRKVIPIESILDAKDENRKILLQFYNVELKRKVRKAKMVELGKPNKFFKSEQDQILQIDRIGLSLFRGISFTLVPINQKIMLQLDICCRIFQEENILQSIKKLNSNKWHKQRLQGQIVFTRYGTCRSYKVLQVDFLKSPLSLFYHFKKGKQMSYKDYYFESYGLKVQDQGQALLRVRDCLEKRIKKGGKEIQTIQTQIYLIPEFTYLSGMTNSQKNNYDTMKQIAKITKLSPTQRIQQAKQYINKLNQKDDSQNIITIQKNEPVHGYVLNKPIIRVRNKNIRISQVGVFSLQKSEIKKQKKLREKKWLFIYSFSPNNAKYDDRDAYDACDLLKESGKYFGVTIQQPVFFDIQKGKDWLKELKDYSLWKDIQFVVCFINHHEEQYYSQLKDFFFNEKKVSSQFIRKKTFAKGKIAIAGKVALQMNAKIGGVLWEVQKSHPAFKNRNVIYGAFSSAKSNKQSILSFVGTANSDMTSFHSQTMNIQYQTGVPTETFQQFYLKWIKKYALNMKEVKGSFEKALPQIIIIYRESQCSIEAQKQLQRQIQAINNIIPLIKKKAKVQTYNPEIVYIFVSKKIPERFYMEDPRFSNQKNLSNPLSGSVIVSGMSKDNAYDFYLAAQYVTQGTCTPTYYRIAYDKSKLPQEALITFTYEQCFNYYNWLGAVRVPACLQYSNKLIKLQNEHLKGEVDENNENRLYFL